MKSDRRLKDPQREKSIFFFRAILAVLIVLGLAFSLIWRLYQLQIIDFDHYQTLSDKNRMQLQSVAPTRGLIYDRDGVLLADNRPIFSVAIILERATDMEGTLRDIGSIISISEDQIDRFHKRSKQKRRPYQPVILKSKLTEEEIARLSVRRHQLPGVEVQAELARHYPLGMMTAHSIGYVGRINEEELKKVDATNYSATNYIGKLGVERFYENELHGRVGYQTVETNASNRILRVLDRVDPEPGRDIHLHLDAELQSYSAELLEGKRAAVVAIEPQTGGILAMVSTPSFDPNLFVTGIDYKSYAELRDSLDLPLFNRSLKGQYPPGSTIKQIVGLAGLDTNTVTRDYTIWDPGWYQLKNDERFYRDWKREGHGRVSMMEAIAESCDTYFYDLAFRLGVDNMSDYLGRFGFGSRTALDIAEARTGILPSRDWKRAVKGRAWYPGDSLNLAIGQGFMLATPLQLATATAVLANKGKFVRPRLLKDISEPEEPFRQLEYEAQDVVLNDPEDWEFIFDTMEEVMHGKRGTARSSGRGAKYRIAGKTGTAQVVGIAQGEEYDEEALAERLRDHALFVGFAPLEDPKIVVSVIVENGGGGSTSAAPVARKIFDAWLHKYDAASVELAQK